MDNFLDDWSTSSLYISIGAILTNLGSLASKSICDDINQIAWLVLPGSKDFGPLANKGEGVRLNAKSLGYLLNLPSPSFITSVSVAHQALAHTMIRFVNAERLNHDP